MTGGVRTVVGQISFGIGIDGGIVEAHIRTHTIIVFLGNGTRLVGQIAHTMDELVDLGGVALGDGTAEGRREDAADIIHAIVAIVLGLFAAIGGALAATLVILVHIVSKEY